MARIRTIKPEFWTDERVGECSMSARLLFIGTWNVADDYGNLDRSAKQLKAQIFPYDNVDCEELLQELLLSHLLTEYAVNGHKYLHISGFYKHQFINRPSKAKFPSPSNSGGLSDHSATTHGSLNVGREGKGYKTPPTPPLKSGTGGQSGNGESKNPKPKSNRCPMPSGEGQECGKPTRPGQRYCDGCRELGERIESKYGAKGRVS